jgi:glutamyl/glutaminyl-tRNA synthetase
LYGDGRFDVSLSKIIIGLMVINAIFKQVTITGNAVIEGMEGKRRTYSIFYGQDYTSDGRRSIMMSEIHQVFDLSDVSDLPTDFTIDDFEHIFNRIFSQGSNVRVLSLVSVVYLIRKSLKNYEQDKVTEGRSHVMLY